MSQPQQNIIEHIAAEDLTILEFVLQAYENLSSLQRLAYDPLFRETSFGERLRLHHEHQRQRQQQQHNFQICMSKLVMYVYHQRNLPLPNSISYWRKFVEEYYDLKAVEKWCFALCNSIEIGVLRRCGDSLTARQCKICGSCSKRHYEANTKILSQVLKSKFESGLVDDFLHLDVPEGKNLPNGNLLLEYEKVFRQMDYRQFSVLYKGKLRLIFNKDVKILSWEFCARQVEVGVPPFQPTTPLIYASVGGLYAGFLEYMTQRKREMRSHINHFGLPLSYCSCFEIIETLDTMKDLMFFSIQHKLGPITSYLMYSEQFHAARSWSQTTETRPAPRSNQPAKRYRKRKRGRYAF